MSKRFASAVPVALLLLGMAAPAQAVPAFARRYEVACHFCHDGFPKLNVMGQRFKERGFRLEKEEGFDFDKWARSIPADLRLTATQLILEDAEDGRFAFFKPISAGNLGPRLSYWVDWGYLVRSDSLTPAGEDNAVTQDVNNAWARLDVVRNGRLYVRAGRMEMDIPFTQVRTPNLFSYDIFNANTGSETDGIAEYQDGVEAGGDLGGELHWSAAVVKGHDSEDVEERGLDEPGRFEANVFLRLAKRSGRSRVGAFAYVGRNHLVRQDIPFNSGWKDDILRLGVDATTWVQRLNVFGAAVYGRNSNSVATPQRTAGTGQELTFSGGFVQVDFHARDALALTARLNVVSRPTSAVGDNETFTSFFPGIRLFVRDRFRLAFEYGFANKGRKGIGAVQADLAF